MCLGSEQMSTGLAAQGTLLTSGTRCATYLMKFSSTVLRLPALCAHDPFHIRVLTVCFRIFM